MKILRKFVLVITFPGLLIYGAYLMKCRLGIDVDEYHHARDYLAAIARPQGQGLADAAKSSSQIEVTPLAIRESPSTTAKITVDLTKEKGAVNPKVYGSNLLGHEGAKAANYGYGLWDGKWGGIQEEPLRLAKETGITMVRFPGGCGSHSYDWKQAVGKSRRQFWFGIDEFLKMAEAIGVEPVFTLSYYTGDEASDADLVEYLNSPNDGTNPNGGIDWTAERAKNGHPQPYGVRYFEIGNEIYHGDHKKIKQILPQDYAMRYLKYYDAIKAVDPDARVGVVLSGTDWNRRVMEIVKDKVDFGIIHTYPTPVWGEKVAEIPAKDIYRISLARPMIQDEYSYREALALLKEMSGRDIPLAITEYNGGFVQDNPVPYRHALGTALINAELLRIFMKPENNILMANYWNFANEYWGMIANRFNGEYRTLNNPYYKRPNYYVFEIYHKHFGDILIDVNVQCVTYDASVYQPIKSFIKRLKSGTLIKGNLIPGRWLIEEFSGAQASENAGILTVDFVDPIQFNYYHARKTTEIEPGAYYKLSGYIKTEGMVDESGVCLEAQDERGWSKTKSASATEKVKGTTDWQYVETIYETLPDAKAVNVIARRIGETGPLKGKAYFKEVTLEKFIPSLDTKIPYLSVNASKSADGKKVYLMVINKNMDAPMTSTIDLKDFAPAAKGNAWVLNGPSVDATNEQKHDNVKMTHKTFEIASSPSAPPNDERNKFEFTFEPHSLTAIEIERK